MTEHNWNKMIDGIQSFMLWILIIVVAVCILSLILFDVLVGTGVMLYLTNGNVAASVFISLATSGLLMALMFSGQTLLSSKKKGKANFGILLLIASAGVYFLDVYFDSLTADYLRFGLIVSMEALPVGDVHIYFRILIGGISTIGEQLAISIILGMPVLKNLISNALPKPVHNNKKKDWSKEIQKARMKEKESRRRRR